MDFTPVSTPERLADAKRRVRMMKDFASPSMHEADSIVLLDALETAEAKIADLNLTMLRRKP